MGVAEAAINAIPAVDLISNIHNVIDVMTKFRLAPSSPTNNTIFEPTKVYFFDYEKLGIFAEEQHETTDALYDFEGGVKFRPFLVPSRSIIDKKTNQTVAKMNQKLYFYYAGVFTSFMAMSTVLNRQGTRIIKTSRYEFIFR